MTRKFSFKSSKRPMVVPIGARSEPVSRIFPICCVVCLIIMLAATASVLAGGRISQLFAQSPGFTLTALEVKGLRRLSGADIGAASGLKVGDNIFEVDLGQVEDRIESLPWVREAFVVRKPPDRLVVSIVERRRLAWVELGKIYGVDLEGVLLPAAGESAESFGELDLPVVSGLSVPTDSLRIGSIVADSALVQILRWWKEASAYDAELCMNISEIQPFKMSLGNSDIRLFLVGDGLEVRLPADRVHERLEVLKVLMKRVYRECPDPAYIDLRFAGQVVVGRMERRS